MITRNDITATRCNCLGSVHLNNYEMSNRIYDPDYICPTIPCYHTDGEVKILRKEIKPAAVRGRDSVNGEYEQRLEISDLDISNALTTVTSTSMLLEIAEPLIVRSVGRDLDNPNDRTSKNIEQRLEIQGDGSMSGTLTTVQKDNLVLETSAIRMVRNDEGKRLRKQYEAHEIKHGFNEYREPEIRDDGCCNTISTVQKDNYVLEQCPISTKGKELDVASTILSGYHRTNMTGFNADNGVMEKVKIKQATEKGYIECEVGGVADLSYPGSKQRRGRVQQGGTVCPTLLAGNSEICRIERGDPSMDEENVTYRIRKLTPKECFRLMGVKDADYDKLTVSNTQKYKQAGNSIVVDVLMAIFDNMFMKDCNSDMLF